MNFFKLNRILRNTEVHEACPATNSIVKNFGTGRLPRFSKTDDLVTQASIDEHVSVCLPFNRHCLATFSMDGAGDSSIGSITQL